MFGKFTAKVEIPGPFKIESEPYTRTIADKTEVAAGDESITKTEPTEVSPTTDVGEAEVPVDDKGGNWTVVSVVIGVFAAAAGIVILKITKIL